MMFEEYTYEYILNRMLNNVSDDIDKREGSVIYNAIAPCAMELTEMYKELGSTINSAFVDTANEEYLDNLTKQFGIERKEATHAVKKGSFYDGNNNLMDVPIGNRFSIDSIIYDVESKISTGVYQLKCETAGEIGNNQSGNLLAIDYVDNLASAILSDLLIPGSDQETDEELRERFYNSVNSVAFGGNIADYKNKVKEIDGVGAVKVIPTWNGGGTVKVIILNSAYNPASSVLLTEVQNEIGENGNGIAPIGHVVTTTTASNFEISITTDIVISESADISTVQSGIETAINEYFTEVKKSWEESDNLIIRIAHIESRILDVDGVVDIANTLLNNTSSNITLTNAQIPHLSEVILNA